MLETILMIIFTGVAGIVAFLIVFARWHYGSLEKLGIPVVKPYFILGSDPDAHKVVCQHRDLERYKMFGPVFGAYEGRIPRVYVCDPEMIRRIMVKDFDHFFDRSVPDWGDEIFGNLLDFLPGEKWKTLRSALTPMFTSSRIRNGAKLYTEITEKYITKLKKEFNGNSTKFEMKHFMTPVFVEFTLDYFLSINIAGDDNDNIRDNYMYKMVTESVGDDIEASFLFTIITVYPFILKIFPAPGKDGIKKFINTLNHVVTVRKAANQDTSNGKDFVDVMVTLMDKLGSPEYERLGIDKNTIRAQAFEMFIAGFDSIVGTSSILSYHFATNPDIQEKVLEEIDALDNKSNDHSMDLPYLTACVKEAIRLDPSFHRLERLCMKEWTYQEGDINVTIPKGMSVYIPAWITNRNPVFKDPEEFHPERYYKDGDDDSYYIEHNTTAQFAMTSFGHGPRNCPGFRVGIEMIKAGMVKILKEFRFECRDDTKADLQVGMTVLTRYKPIYVDIVKRSEQ